MKQTSLTIGKYASAAGVGVETVRYYQRKGLLQRPETPGGVNRYGEDDIRRLRFIRKAQQAGFTLNEIKQLMMLDSSQDHHRAYAIAMDRLQQLEVRIAEMQQARDSLKKLAGECASGKKDQPCAILAAFGV